MRACVGLAACSFFATLFSHPAYPDDPVQAQKPQKTYIVVKCSDPRKEDCVQKWVDSHCGDAYWFAHLGGPLAFTTSEGKQAVLPQLERVCHEFCPTSSVEIILISHIDCGGIGRNNTFPSNEEQLRVHKEVHQKSRDVIAASPLLRRAIVRHFVCNHKEIIPLDDAVADPNRVVRIAAR